MDTIELMLTRILTTIADSSLSNTEKADLYVQIQVGMRKLVWPILLIHVPEYMLKEVAQSKEMTMDTYTELIEASLANPATPKEIHDELIRALQEVETLLKQRIPAPSKANAS